MNRLNVVVFAVILLVFGICFFMDGTTGRAGQIVFTPKAGLGPPIRGHSEGLTITDCEEVDEGLRVAGRVAPQSSPVQIVVSGAGSSSTGVRMGMAFLKDSRPGRVAEVGDFVVVLPWATGQSEFAVVAEGGTAVGHGLVSICPRATSTAG